jgi:hypothetical protein
MQKEFSLPFSTTLRPESEAPPWSPELLAEAERALEKTINRINFLSLASQLSVQEVLRLENNLYDTFLNIKGRAENTKPLRVLDVVQRIVDANKGKTQEMEQVSTRSDEQMAAYLQTKSQTQEIANAANMANIVLKYFKSSPEGRANFLKSFHSDAPMLQELEQIEGKALAGELHPQQLEEEVLRILSRAS